MLEQYKIIGRIQRDNNTDRIEKGSINSYWISTFDFFLALFNLFRGLYQEF